MKLEPDLDRVGPGRLDSVVLDDVAEVLVIRWREILEDGEHWADAVGGRVGHGGECILLMFEDQTSDEVGVELDNYGAG